MATDGGPGEQGLSRRRVQRAVFWLFIGEWDDSFRRPLPPIPEPPEDPERQGIALPLDEGPTVCRIITAVLSEFNPNNCPETGNLKCQDSDHFDRSGFTASDLAFFADTTTVATSK